MRVRSPNVVRLCSAFLLVAGCKSSPPQKEREAVQSEEKSSASESPNRQTSNVDAGSDEAGNGETEETDRDGTTTASNDARPQPRARPDTDGTSQPDSTTRTDETTDDESPTDTESASITEEGFEPLMELEGRLTIAELEKAFPDYEVRYTEESSEGISYKLYALVKGGEIAVKFDNVSRVSDIDEVTVLTPDLHDEHGVRVGMTVDEVQQELGELDCRIGAETTKWAHCETDSDTPIGYLLDVGDVDTGQCNIDCRIAPEYIGDEEIDGIVWSR